MPREPYANSYKTRPRPFQDNDMNSYSTTDTDWADVYYDTGTYRRLPLSGGREGIRYYISGDIIMEVHRYRKHPRQVFSAEILTWISQVRFIPDIRDIVQY